MPSTRRSIVLSLVALFAVVVAGLQFVPFASITHVAHAATSAVAKTAAGPRSSTTANGPYTVQGNKILDKNGNQYLIHGIGRDGLEYNCSGDGFFDQQHLSYMGSGTNGANAVYWYANTVRLPLSEGFWLKGAPGFPCSSANYQSLVKSVVDSVTALHMNVLIDLQWTDAGGQSGQGGGPWAMPDQDSVTFWTQVAGIYKNYSNVMFEVSNEPHPGSWACWKSGCTMTNDKGYSSDCNCQKTLTYTAVGMQALVTAIRNAGANNLAIVGGMNWGFDLSQIPSNTISGGNIVYDTHPYPYADKQPGTWDAAFGTISKTYAVVSAESGEYDCGVGFMSLLLTYFDNHNIGWIAWAWTSAGSPCTYPQLVMDYNGTPAQFMGTLIYQRLRSYAGLSTQTPPVNQTWYFAEGRVGAGFTEYLTLGNPDPLNDCTVQVKYLRQGSSSVTKTVTVAHASRLTESVNADLGTSSSSSTAYSVSSIVTVTNPATCSGIMAERPLYFSYHGINSGNDVVGATSLGKTFYFGDVPTGSGYSSFITVLNPQGTTANIQATYYAGGKSVGSQTLQVGANTRNTLSPPSGMPMHVAAVVTSDQSVMVERPDYYSNVNAGAAGTISGGSTVVGVQKLQNDWLFAEGFTGNSNQPNWQEYLVIANVDPAHTSANVAVTLQNTNGSTKQVNLTVGSLSQSIVNVNQATPQSSVSAEVKSTGANIVVEREMFFKYNHTVSGTGGFTVAANGGDDVVGMPANSPNQTAYTFAEGYTAKNFNEWLTLQNPTGSSEAIYITLVNGLGQVYSPSGIVVPAHSRSTIDITQMVLQHLYTGSDTRGYSVSLTVQSYANGAVFVAERPEYWNHNGTQGGDDVIGFAG